MNKISQVFGLIIYLEIFYLGKYILLQVLICSDNMGTKFWNCFSQNALLLSWYLLFSRSVVSDSLQSHGLQGQASLSFTISQSLLKLMSIAWSQWCHSNILSSVIPFSSCIQSFLASGSFPISWLFASGGQNIGASASSLPMNNQGWFPLGLTGLIPLQSKRLSGVFCNTTAWESINSSALSILYGPTLTSIHDYWKNHSFD